MIWYSVFELRCIWFSLGQFWILLLLSCDLPVRNSENLSIGFMSAVLVSSTFSSTSSDSFLATMDYTIPAGVHLLCWGPIPIPKVRYLLVCKFLCSFTKWFEGCEINYWISSRGKEPCKRIEWSALCRAHDVYPFCALTGIVRWISPLCTTWWCLLDQLPGEIPAAKMFVEQKKSLLRTSLR